MRRGERERGGEERAGIAKSETTSVCLSVLAGAPAGRVCGGAGAGGCCTVKTE